MSEHIAETGLSEGREYLTFLLADEEYAVEILRVEEIRVWSPVTRLPNSPKYVKGVLNLRGAIIPIIDLRTRFGLPTSEYGPTTVVIVVKVMSGEKERVMGIVVDAVMETYRILESQVLPPPKVHGQIDTEYLRGLATMDERMIVILDVDHVMNSGELAIVEMQGAEA
ncbi:MAG: chemotaxis protein CheW [Pontibacterium sp.]